MAPSFPLPAEAGVRRGHPPRKSGEIPGSPKEDCSQIMDDGEATSSGRRGFLSPAIALLGRLRYPQKFALISLLFILPLSLVLYLLISEINGRVLFARKEIMGNAYLRPLRRLMEDFPAAKETARNFEPFL